jgi:hypothetical protein
LKAAIVSESIQGIEVAGKKTYSANDIEDVNYENLITEITKKLQIYRPADDAEKKALKEKTADAMAQKLMEAAQIYAANVTKLDPKLTAVKRHFEFKAAYLPALAALAGGAEKDKNTAAAIAALIEFKKNHPNSWQYTPVMLMLGKLELGKSNYAGARKIFQELADTVGVPEGVKQEVEYQNIQLYMQEKDFAEAQKRLSSLIPRLKKGTVQSLQARLDEIRCIASLDQRKEAIAKVDALQKEIGPENKAMKALVYNTLGELYYLNDEMQEARWPFLWVDVIYNEDAAQHAKALYYLHKIFRNLREDDRAQECYQMLTSDPRFTGMEYQKMIIEERKKGG